jgi:hypothetical protein
MDPVSLMSTYSSSVAIYCDCILYRIEFVFLLRRRGGKRERERESR